MYFGFSDNDHAVGKGGKASCVGVKVRETVQPFMIPIFPNSQSQDIITKLQFSDKSIRMLVPNEQLQSEDDEFSSPTQERNKQEPRFAHLVSRIGSDGTVANNSVESKLVV